MAQATQKRPMSLLEARQIADDILTQLKPLCGKNRCVVAGSVRRKVERPGDIEIVCLPKTGKATSPGELLPREQNLVIHWINEQHVTHHGIKLVKGGPRYHQILYGSAQVDIFMPLPAQWGRMLAIRTGPADFVKKMGARWKQLGYKGHNGVLLLERRYNKETEPQFPTEESFFEFLNWDYIEPEKRR